MQRASPIRHRVRTHHREGKLVHTYMRGSGYHQFEVHRMSTPSYLSPTDQYKLLALKEREKYLQFLKNDSLHGGLVVEKPIPSNVELKLITVNRDDIDYFTSDRPSFRESVEYWKDQVRNSRTIPPILCHRLPNGRMCILDGQARVQAWHELGIESGYPCVENSLMDSLKSLGSKVKEKTSGFLVKAEGYGHNLGNKAANYVAEDFHNRAKGLAFDIKEKAKEDRAKLWEGAKGFAHSQMEEGKTHLIQNLQSGRVQLLLKQAQSPDLYTASNAKRELKRRYNDVWMTTPWAEKVEHVVHETGISQEAIRKEKQLEKAEAEKVKLEDLRQRALSKKLYVKGNLDGEKTTLTKRAFFNDSGESLTFEPKTEEERTGLSNYKPPQLFTPEEKEQIQKRADELAKNLREEDRGDFQSRGPYYEQMAKMSKKPEK